MLHRHYRLELMLEGPVLSQAAGTLAFGLDAAMQRYRNRPALNGAQIRGNIRHVLKRFNHEEYMSCMGDWFPDEQELNQTRRSSLNLDLFWLPVCLQGNSGERVRIEIGDRNVVSKGSLQVIEDLFPAGSTVTFSGIIRARFENGNEQDLFEKWMDKALQWLDAIGSLKGVGYGRLAGHQLTAMDAPLSVACSLPQETTRFGLRLKPDRPFCLGRQQSKSDNRIVSSNYIPGEVIKAILAERFKERFPDDDLAGIGFDDIIINHARPVAAAASRLLAVMPLNVAVMDNKVISITVPTAGKKWKQAPAFQPDWKDKDRDRVQKALGIFPVFPKRLLLVRTAINPATGTARESSLFSLECVEPEGHEWLADVDLSRLDEAKRKLALECLPQLLGGELGPIGKTGAVACVSIEQAFSPPPAVFPNETCWQLTLQTPARLLPHDLQPGNVNTDELMKEQYQQYLDQVSDSSLELINAFTQQMLYGGEYHFHHFQKDHGQPYQPEWRVMPGSVFILKARRDREETAREKIAQWTERNLPAREDDIRPAHWEHTPTLPEHGYGEIRVQSLKQGGGQ